MRDTPPDKPSLVPLFLGGVLAAVLCLAGLLREPWLDEAATLRIVTTADWLAWVRAFLLDQQPPMYPLLLTLWAEVSASVPWLRLLSVLCGAMAVMLAARWATRITPRAGFVAAALLAGSPFFLRYSLELRPYALLSASAAGAFLAAHRWATERPLPVVVRASLMGALVLACTTHFTAILLVPATVVLIAATRPGAGAARWPWTEYGVAVVVWAGLLAAQRQTLPRLAGDWWMPPLSAPLAARTFAEMAGLTSPGTIGGAGTLFALAGLGTIAVVLFASAPVRTWAPPLAAAVVYCAAVALVSLALRAVWWPRTLLPAVVPFAVALSVAAGAQRVRAMRLASSALLVVLAAAGAARWVAQDGREPIEPWRDAAAGLLADGSVPTVCVPDYAAWPLAAVLPDDRAHQLLPVRLATTPEARDAAIAPALDRLRHGGPVNLVIRVDLSLQREPALVDALAGALATARTRHGGVSAPGDPRGAVHVALVSSPDVSLAPGLAHTARAVELALTARLGAAAERSSRRGITLLVY